MLYRADCDLWFSPIGGGMALACGVGFPMRVMVLPRLCRLADGPMPCGLSGRWIRSKDGK